MTTPEIRIFAPSEPGDAVFQDDSPFLEFSRHPLHGEGWTLWYLDANANPNDHYIAGEITDGGWALSQAREFVGLVREARA